MNGVIDSPVSATIPFDVDGKHTGFLTLAHSRDDSAWGSVMIPLCVIRNGQGSVALLTGGNHGDEYEGPLALQGLANELDVKSISGTVIIVPMMNHPAVMAGTRTSPIDKGNMNRSFPGSRYGTITQKIADYFQRVLIPMSDVVLDFHSGGKTLDFVPFAAAHILPDKAQQEACMQMMHAFNAPYSTLLLEMDNVGMYDTAVESQGKIFVSTELGGGGTSTARSVAIARRGVGNVLIQAGITHGQIQREDSTELDMPDNSCYHISNDQGMIETRVDLGESIAKGDLLARVWSMTNCGTTPVNYYAQRSGILMARHFPGIVKPGDCVAVIAQAV